LLDETLGCRLLTGWGEKRETWKGTRDVLEGWDYVREWGGAAFGRNR
jgi:hypothetical protein